MPWVFVLIWSTGFVVARLAMPHAPPFGFLSLRFALSAACFVIWLRLAGAQWPATRAQWGHLAVTGVLIQAGYLGGVWAAVKAGIGAGTVALIVGLQPVLTALWIVATSPRERASAGPGRAAAGVAARQWLGLGFGLGGLTLVVWHKLGVGEVTPANFAMSLAALAGITIGTLYQKRYVGPCDVRSASAVQMLAALAVSLPLALFETAPFEWHLDLVLALAWSVGVLTLGGSSLLYLLIQRGEATAVTSLLYLVPPTTALMALALFREPFTASMALGMMLAVAGVALVLHPGGRPAALASERSTS